MIATRFATVAIRASGYFTETLPIEPGFEDLDLGRIVLHSTAHLTVSVRTESGDLVPSASILVADAVPAPWRMAPATFAIAGTTDARGELQIDIPPQGLLVYARQEQKTSSVQVAADTVLQTLHLTIRSQPNFILQLVSASTQSPLPDVVLDLVRDQYDTPERLRFVTGPDGIASGWVREGTYSIVFPRWDWTIADRDRWVSIASEGQLRLVTAEPERHVRVRVIDRITRSLLLRCSLQIVPERLVHNRDWFVSPLDALPSPDREYFYFPNPAVEGDAAAWQLFCGAEGYSQTCVRCFPGSWGARKDIEVTVDALPPCRIRVKWPDESPAPGIDVRVRQLRQTDESLDIGAGVTVASGLTDATGVWVFGTGSPGIYVVDVKTQHSSFYQPAGFLLLPLAEGEVTLCIPERGRIVGKLVGCDGLGEFDVAVCNIEGTIGLPEFTGDSFYLDDIPPGQYSVAPRSFLRPLRLSSDCAGDSRWPIEVAVCAGETTEIEIDGCDAQRHIFRGVIDGLDPGLSHWIAIIPVESPSRDDCPSSFVSNATRWPVRRDGSFSIPFVGIRRAAIVVLSNVDGLELMTHCEVIELSGFIRITWSPGYLVVDDLSSIDTVMISWTGTEGIQWKSDIPGGCSVPLAPGEYALAAGLGARFNVRAQEECVLTSNGFRAR